MFKIIDLVAFFNEFSFEAESVLQVTFSCLCIDQREQVIVFFSVLVLQPFLPYSLDQPWVGQSIVRTFLLNKVLSHSLKSHKLSSIYAERSPVFVSLQHFSFIVRKTHVFRIYNQCVLFEGKAN